MNIYVYRYTYIYIYTYIYVYVYTYIYVYMYTRTKTYPYTCGQRNYFILACTHGTQRLPRYRYMYVCVCVHIHIHIHIHVYFHVYQQPHTCIYTHTQIHEYTFAQRNNPIGSGTHGTQDCARSAPLFCGWRLALNLRQAGLGTVAYRGGEARYCYPTRLASMGLLMIKWYMNNTYVYIYVHV